MVSFIHWALASTEDNMIHPGRFTATLDGDFVLFLIGMRINQPLKVHKWFPVAQAMPRMLKELQQQPQLGYLHGELWFSRTIVMVQYWRSLGQLLDYAKNPQNAHLPAWRQFNSAIGSDGSVGIWHETYQIRAGSYENIYVNMPPFGLGAVAPLQAATGGKSSAAGRLKQESQ